MKKIIALSVVVSMLPSLTWAGSHGNHPMAGCGLGYLLLSNKDNDQPTQIVGATTNATGMQTFGISSGTSGCTQDGAVKLAKETEVFAEVNLDSLRREMAAGQGEFVNTLAAMLGADAAGRPAMVKFFQANYQDLFPTTQTTSTEMLNVLAAKLVQHPELLG